MLANETIIPIVPDSAGAIPANDSPRQVPSPRRPEAIAASFVALLPMSPQRNGPRKKEPSAPHESERIATIVAGRKKARTTERRTKTAAMTRIKRVRSRSPTPGLMKPA